MVGASANWVRPSNFAMKYLLGKGYNIIPINPNYAGKKILGQMTFANLHEIEGNVEMIDIFRSSESAVDIVDEAISLKNLNNLQIIWMQLGVRNDVAAERAKAAGLKVIMDRCPKIEYGRLFGELSWIGVNTGVITSRRRKPV